MGATFDPSTLSGTPPPAAHRRAMALTRLLARLVDSASRESSLRAVCEETAAALDVPMVTLRVIDPATGLTSSVYAHGAPQGFAPTPVPAEAREAFLRAHGDVACFPDLAVRPDVPGSESLLAAKVRSLAHARMTSHGRTVGMLFAASFDGPMDLDGDALRFLETAAGIAAVAVASVRVAERYERIVTAMSEAVLVVHSDGRVAFANPAAEKFFGRNATDLAEMALAELATDPLPAPEEGRKTLRFRHPDGQERWGMATTTRFDSATATGATMTVVRDVTESRKLEAKMRETQKLESLGVLAGGVAHDFNNLLVGILGNVGLALDEVETDSSVAATLHEIQAAALRAAELTRQLLAYAGKGRFVIGRIDLVALVEEMRPLLAAAVPKQIALSFVLPTSLPTVEADASQLRQILMNLVSNAADAIGAREGAIRVSVRSAELDASRIATLVGADGATPGPFVEIEVVDTGEGMSADTRAKIFDPFFTTKFVGRGLGLAAVAGALRAHRGGIDVESEPGRGSTFRAYLPVFVEKAAPEPVSSRAPGPIAGAPLVLVVDDDPAVRRVQERTLVRAGLRVLTAADGDEGVATFRARPSDVALVVLDLTMPRMGGQATLEALRAIDPSVRVVLTSGFSESEATARFAGLDLAGFVAKPFLPAELRAKVLEVLGTRPGPSHG